MLAQLFWNAPNHWPIAVLVGIGLLAGTIWLYPPQTRAMSRFWQVTLPLLRVLAIALISLSLLKPTLVRVRTQEEHGAVVLLVDRSASMGIVDSQMPSAERVALADVVGVLPRGVRTQTAPEAIQAIRRLQRNLERVVRAESDLEYARLTSRRISRREMDCEEAYVDAFAGASEVASALKALGPDESLRAKLDTLRERPDVRRRGDWRKQVAEMLGPIETMLHQKQAASDDALYKANSVVRNQCDEIVGKSRFSLVEQFLVNDETGLLRKFAPDVPLYGYSFAGATAPLPLRSGSDAVKRLVVEPDGRQTRLEGAIASALDDLKGRPVRGVILLSDGRPVGESPAAQISGVVPVFSVGCGEQKAYTDLSIASVEMPTAAYAGESVTVVAHLKAVNIPPGEYDVSFSCGDEHVTQKVRLDANGTGQISATFHPAKAGVSRIDIKAATLPKEATDANNTFSRPMKVIQDKLNVLLLSSYASWDYQYVRNALSRTKWARLTDAIAPGDAFAITPEQIMQQDVLVLFRVTAAMLNTGQIDAIHRAVTEKGASLILTAGAGEDLDTFSRNALLSEFLPYRAGSKPVWRSWPGDRPAFRIVPDGTAAGMNALRLSDDPTENSSRWMSLPAVYHYLSIPQLKPNAVRTMLVEKESRLPVLVESRLGLGRILFLGVQESWRWRMRVAERDQDRFWLQLIRYSAEEPYAIVSNRLAMDLDKVSARPGEDVHLRVRETAQLAAPHPSVELQQQGKVMRIEQPVERGAGQPGRYDVVLRDLPEGSYDVVVKVPGEQNSSIQMPLDISYEAQAELADVSADPGELQQISSLSGGAFMKLSDAGDIARQVSQLSNRFGTTVEIPIWNSGYLFAAVLSLLSIEWAMRKRRGLA